VDADDAYLLDLCDAAIGEPARRGVELPWARAGGDPDGPPMHAHGWYPQARVVVLVADGEEDDRAYELARLATPYDVAVLVVARAWLERDAAGAVRRLPADGERIARHLGDPEARDLHRVWPEAGGAVFGLNVAGEAGWTAYADLDSEDWDENEGEDDEDEDDEAERLAEEAERWPGTADFVADTEAALGWRGHAAAMAVLGALTLARRAFSVEATGHGLSEEAFEALLVLLAGGAPDGPALTFEPAELARLLRREEHTVIGALRELQRAGFAEPLMEGARADGGPPLVLGVDMEWEWALTAAGREAGVAWVARVLPAFAGWPPEVPGIDDAGGPEVQS
jgi:hypothetical protein